MTAMPVLVATSDDQTHESARIALASLGDEGVGPVSHAHNDGETVAHLDGHLCALLLFDLGDDPRQGLEHLALIIARHPDLTVVALSAGDHAETAAACIHRGAYDHLAKPLEPERTRATIRRALGLRPLRSAPLPRPGNPPDDAFAGFITDDRKMRTVMDYVRMVAGTGQPLLITGETGTGKDLLAHAAHRISRRKGAFVPVNVSGMDDAMVTDTLFGHRRGAFTGANNDRPGLVLRASAGTLFLDEIGDLTPVSQVKLLRLLQDGEYYPLGSDQQKYSTACIVAATSVDLPQLMTTGRFRQDLYYRLRAHQVALPPLRERRGDLPLLLRFFVNRAAAVAGRPPIGIPVALDDLLNRHQFPGNIRELQALVHDAVARTPPEQLLDLEAFQLATAEFRRDRAPGNRALVFPTPLPAMTETLDALIAEALRRAQGNQAEAARKLGISRQALNKRLRA